MAIRVAAYAELCQGLKPEQTSRALNGLRDIRVTERERRWYVIDTLLRRYGCTQGAVDLPVS